MTHLMESPQWALDQLAQYKAAANTFAGAMDTAYDAKQEVARVRAQLKDIEAQVIVNGVTGRNAEERAAAVSLEVQKMPGYQTVVDHLRKSEREHSEAENEADDASNQMRGARLALEYATAYLHRMAAAEGRRGMEERHVNSGTR